MRMILAGAALLAAVGSAEAQCNRDLISVESWSIEPEDARTNRMNVQFRFNTDRAVRMIDASAGYRDALGGTIASFSLPRDVNVPAGGTLSYDGLWGPYTFERLLVLVPEEVETHTCVRSVLYEDGTREDF